MNIFQLTRFFSYVLSFVAFTNIVFDGHLLAKVASSLGVQSSRIFGQNKLID